MNDLSPAKSKCRITSQPANRKWDSKPLVVNGYRGIPSCLTSGGQRYKPSGRVPKVRSTFGGDFRMEKACTARAPSILSDCIVSQLAAHIATSTRRALPLQSHKMRTFAEVDYLIVKQHFDVGDMVRVSRWAARGHFFEPTILFQRHRFPSQLEDLTLFSLRVSLSIDRVGQQQSRASLIFRLLLRSTGTYRLKRLTQTSAGINYLPVARVSRSQDWWSWCSGVICSASVPRHWRIQLNASTRCGGN